MLEMRQLGTSDLLVSPLGLGCMSLGTDRSKAEAIVKTALENGINYFDTADLYDFGENEKILGSVLKAIPRDQVIIATKAGNRWNDSKDGWYWDPSKAYIKRAVKASLKRLNTDYIDLFQLHGGTLDDPIVETIEAFEELKAEGLIRYYGISSIRPNVIREYLEKANLVSVMMQYSMLDRRPEEAAMLLLHEHRISVVTRGALAKGLLTERMLAKANPSLQEKGYLDYSYTELKQSLTALSSNLNRPLQETALQYNLAQPAVASVVVGASSVQQLQENIHAAQSEPLKDEEISLIQSLTKANLYDAHR